MSDSQNGTPHTEDTTPEQLQEMLAHAEKLLKSVEEEIQNPLANAQKRMNAGKEVELSKVLERARKAVADVEHQARTFPGRAGQTAITDVSALDLIDGYWQHVSKRKACAPTGIAGLNNLLGGGLESQRLMVLLGAPGGGKTTFANQIAVYASESGRPVLYVTSEDSPYTLLAKTIARKGQIPYGDVLKGKDDRRANIEAAMLDYRQSTSVQRLRYLDASMMVDMETVRDKARTHFEQFKDAKDGGQGILVIDYLQRLARGQASYRNGNQDLRQAVTVLTEQLRSIATELDCCVLALASMNRASGYGATNNNALSSAKESGDIEYTADVIMALVDEENRVSSASFLSPKALRLDKNRQGATNVLHLDWYADRQQFTEVNVTDGDYFSPASNGNGKKKAQGGR